MVVSSSLVLLAACGGEVTPPANGSGGSGGAGGSGSSSSSSSGTGGATAECPLDPPTSGAPCNVAMDESCNYATFDNLCCPRTFHCNAGTWEEADVSCPAQAVCPPMPPKQGDPCSSDSCLQDSPCGYACDKGSAVFAECKDGAWVTSAAQCSDVVTCNGVDCAPGEICVETAGGAGFFYKCAPNPCAPGPLSCQCAGPTICGNDPPTQCTVTSSSQVSCACLVCP
jgi:hypothetical protein